MVQFLLGQGRERRIDHDHAVVDSLKDALCLIFVGFFLNMTEVDCLFLLVCQTFFVGVQADVGVGDASRDFLRTDEECGLANILWEMMPAD